MAEEALSNGYVLRGAPNGISVQTMFTESIHISRETAFEVYAFLSTWIAEQPYETILLMGGPKHGEWLVRPKSEYTMALYTLPLQEMPNRWFDSDAAPVMEITQHLYTKASDYAYGVARLPFHIFEHQSLCDMNVERKAKRLSAVLDEKARKYDESRSTTQVARDASGRAYKAARAAEAEEISALDALMDVQATRDQLTVDYGI